LVGTVSVRRCRWWLSSSWGQGCGN
jgi:hypothetical protein